MSLSTHTCGMTPKNILGDTIWKSIMNEYAFRPSQVLLLFASRFTTQVRRGNNILCQSHDSKFWLCYLSGIITRPLREFIYIWFKVGFTAILNKNTRWNLRPLKGRENFFKKCSSCRFSRKKISKFIGFGAKRNPRNLSIIHLFYRWGNQSQKSYSGLVNGNE